jgi:long-chain acyl-CoA synthetase
MVIDNITVDENDVAAIIYTGGTTGVKKGVKLTNKNFNSLAYYHQICGIPHSHGQKMLNFMPPFIAYGVVDGMHMPLCVGWTIDMQPKFEFCDFPKTVEKGKYNILMASPVHYEFMQKYKSNKDFSFLDMAISGGDSMSKEFEIKMNKWFKEHNSDVVLGQGLGMTEASSVMTLPFPNKIKTGSVGFPFSITNMGIFEPGTTNEVVGNELGEICFYGDTIMKGYLNNSDDEKKVLIEHEDGKKWLHSGDIGFIDDEGYVFIVNRIKRIINRNGLKVFPSEIEKIAMKHPNVDMAVAVGVENEKERNVPILHLSLKNIEETNKTINEIIDMCRETFFEEYIPYGIKIRTQFPYTDNGKMDYIKLASEQYEGVIITKKISKVYTLKK